MPPLAKGGGDTWTTPLAGSHPAMIFGDTASQTSSSAGLKSTMHSVDKNKDVVTKAPVHRRGSSFRGLLKTQEPSTNADHGSIDVDYYATNHDELVTSLIDEALKLPLADTSSSASAGDASKEMKSEGGIALKVKNSKHSPLRRSITRQLGSPLKRQRSSVTASADGNRSPKKLDRGELITSDSKVPSHVLLASSFLHPDCVLRKEKAELQNRMQITFGLQNSKQQLPNSCTSPAAVGREETLAKLSEKLRMLGEIESGKYGQAAEMRRSDAVSFLLAPEPQQKGHRRGNSLSSLPANHPKQSIKVETRSLLSLKMGFVSMNYGIQLVWNTDCRLVEMVVLRKMCRDDFLLQGSSPAPTSSVADGDRACHKRSSSTSSHNSMSQAKRLSPLKESRARSSRQHHVESSGQGSRREGNRAGRPSPTLKRVGSAISNIVPRFLTGSDSKTQSYLSVSVVNVNNLHGGCEHCRNPETSSPKSWSMFDGSPPNFALNTSHRRSTRKRKHPTVRPYVRFILGDNEHATKVAKYNKGNPKFTKRHYNSCLLPCPPEELRWFAGQEDLVVEVRNNWVHGPIGGQCDDPLLATVIVPLSSVNLEDEGGSGTFWTKRRAKSAKGGSSTNVTLPLRMTCCPVAPHGSINLQITIKVPKPEDCPTTVSSTVAKSNVEEFVDDSTGDLQVSESIELGPITRLIDGLTFCQSGPCSADDPRISTDSPSARSSYRSNSLGSPSKTIQRLRRLRWSKYYDPTTRRWSALQQKSPTSAGDSITSRQSLSGSARSHSSGQKINSSASRDGEGWFTFLR